MKKKIVALLLACMLIVGITAGGTLAWLTAQTTEVVNTFTVGDINLELTEHKLVNEELSETETTPTNAYNYVPGDTLPKDPWVTVKSGSEACYVFIKVEETNNILPGSTAEKIINYTVDDNVWTAATDHDGYYYHTIDSKLTADETLNILAGKTVTVSENVTKEMIPSITGGNCPKLIFTAAAIQKDNLPTVEGRDAVQVAWETLFGTTP